MTEDASEISGGEGPTGPVEQSAGGGTPDESSEAPRKRGLLPKKRAPKERAKRPTGQKKRLFGARASSGEDGEGIEPAPTSEEPASAPAEATNTESEKPDRPRRGLLPRRKSRKAEPVADDQPTTAFAAAEAEASTGEAPEAAPGRRRRKKRAPTEKKSGAPRSQRAAPASSLRRERRALLSSRQDAVYHLGGLAFELYRRDLLQDGVLRQRAVELAAVDDRIREIDEDIGERPARGRRAATAAAAPAVAGNCLTCRAQFAPEARFCSNCGARFAPQAAESEHVTGVIEMPPEGSSG
jgi:hypothetical protein